ncbi:hypothetical protein GA0070616_1067 [Micromonospora nigra]|uniref:Uncharacterized protein n=1 Tax=Micromonospora nigra TaxID=145857 RepID=A0A1C6RHN9_9ACTN|nr:hypothetical protein [Micromonospora nigra]SCL16624.1 hypothetical protein GA0070616_1067 [Micromonospora nigra]
MWELRRVAAGVAGVEVLSVRRDGSPPTAGTRLVFRVRVDKTASSLFGWQRARSSGCFAQLVRTGSEPSGLERLPCPA